MPGCDGTGMAERSYPKELPRVRNRGGAGWGRGAAERTYPVSEVRGSDERSYPASEVRGGSRES